MPAWWPRRPKPPRSGGSQAAIEAFWTWWTQAGADTAARAIDDRAADTLVPLIASRVKAIHPGLAWELAPGPEGSEHVLVVSPEGNADLRAPARRWLLGAPPPDRTWAYSDSRLPRDDGLLVLRIEGHEFSSDDVVVTWEPDHRRDCLDVTVHHPAMARVPEHVRQQLTVLVLDHTLGESAVETWIGGIDLAMAPPPLLPEGDDDADDADDDDGGAGVGGLVELRVAVSAFVDNRIEDDGNPVWNLLEVTDEDEAVTLALYRVPLRSTSAPHLEQHVELTLPFRHITAAGLPDDPSLQALRAFSDAAEETCAPHGMLVAHESSSGRRLLHFYADPLSDAEEKLRRLSSEWVEGTPAVRSTRDPGWEQVAHLRG